MSASSEAVDRLGPVLASEMPLDGLLLVSASRPTRVLWHDESSDPVDAAPLTDFGRLRLAAPDSADDTADPDGSLGVIVLDESSVPCAVLFATRARPVHWSDTERRVVTTSVALLRSELLDLVGRPRPGERVNELEESLRDAADRGELVLLYQPEIDLHSGKVLAVEALVRWDHPVYGRLGPDSFITIAERSDLISVLGTWIIERAIADFSSFGVGDVMLRVNVSPAQLGGDGVVGRFAEALAKYGVPGSRVCVEFTETSGSGEVAEFASTLRALGELGITTAMDDLATGYSTLSRLRTLPVDTVKIDRSLISGIDRDPRARAIVDSLVKLASALDLEAVAEGVETVDELHTLLDLGCRRAQGHLFGRPQEVLEIDALLRDGPVRLP